jgi:hypothetical protein
MQYNKNTSEPKFSLLIELAKTPEILRMASPLESGVILRRTSKTLKEVKFDVVITGRPDIRRFPYGIGMTESIQSLVAAFETVKTLDLSRMSFGNFGAAVLACHIPRIKGLENLILVENLVGVSKKQNVIFNLNHPGVAERFPSVLAYLSANQTHPGKTGIANLLLALLEAKNLRRLDIRWNAFGYEDWSHLLHLARKSMSLQVLLAGHNCEFLDSTLPELVETVKETRLTVFSLAGIVFKSKTAVEIIRALRTNSTLKVLDISGVRMDESALIEALQYALEKNTTLKTLHIDQLDETGTYDSTRKARVLERMPRPFTLEYGGL